MNVYAGVNLDGTFNSYPEAAEYLDEEGFSRNIKAETYSLRFLYICSQTKT